MSALKRLGINVSTVNKEDIGDAELSATQQQTKESFGFKWAKREAYESEHFQDFSRQWLVRRYLDNDSNRLNQLLGGKGRIILDAGCGSAYSALLLFGDLLKEHDYLGVDISDSVTVAQQRFRERGYPGDFLQADLQDLPIPENSVDLIFSEGVLHHTDDTGASIVNLTKKLKKDGVFMFYVYAKKAIIREYSDDFIREQLKDLPHHKAWDVLKPLTHLGIALGKLNAEIDVPEDIPILGIKAGKMDVQRFFYWNICKMFYRPDMDFDEMHLINFDWFSPLNCHRHTEEEVRAFCERAGLNIERLSAEEAGFTVVARKV